MTGIFCSFAKSAQNKIINCTVYFRLVSAMRTALWQLECNMNSKKHKNWGILSTFQTDEIVGARQSENFFQVKSLFEGPKQTTQSFVQTVKAMAAGNTQENDKRVVRTGEQFEAFQHSSDSLQTVVQPNAEDLQGKTLKKLKKDHSPWKNNMW